MVLRLLVRMVLLRCGESLYRRVNGNCIIRKDNKGEEESELFLSNFYMGGRSLALMH